MKAIGFVSGIALGMAAAVAAVSAVYPDIPKRAKRDKNHMWRSMKSKHRSRSHKLLQISTFEAVHFFMHIHAQKPQSLNRGFLFYVILFTLRPNLRSCQEFAR